MKKQINITTLICDHCKKNKAYGWDVCLECGKDCCHTCEEKGLAVEYPHAVYFCGSGDGNYCKTCDQKLTAQGTDKRHNAYRVIAQLRTESKAWNEDFKRRVDAAESALSKFTKRP